METGFNLFFLSSIFSGEVQLPNEMLAEKEYETKKQKGILADNIVTKWGQVLVSVVKTGVSTVQSKLFAFLVN